MCDKKPHDVRSVQLELALPTGPKLTHPVLLLGYENYGKSAR